MTFNHKELKKVAKQIARRSPHKLYLVGSMRRNVQENIKDIDFLTTHSLHDIAAVLVPQMSLKTDAMILRYKHQLPDGRYVPIEIYYAPPESKPFARLHFIGNANFNIAMRAHAIRKGYKLNQYGLFYAGTDKPVNHQFRNEREIFEFLQFPWKSYSARSM
jgi:DNA polymerase (family 10)